MVSPSAADVTSAPARRKRSMGEMASISSKPSARIARTVGMRVSGTRMTVDAHGNFSGKRLVIFGAGYVGSAVARAAVARGLHVTALTRNPEKAARLRELGVTTVIADLAEPTWHAQIDGQSEF